MFRYLAFGIFLLSTSSVLAQHQEAHIRSEGKQQLEHHFGHHRLAVLLGHTRILSSEGGKGLLIPSWGLDYEYWFNPRWGLGLHTDLELQTFIIYGSNEEDDIERDYPLVMSLDGLYNPWKGLILELGGGIEFDKHGNFGIIQIGAEYEIRLPNNWDIFPTVFYDSRIGAYDTWTIALGVGKRL